MYQIAWRVLKVTPILIAIEDCLYGPAFVKGRSMQPTLNSGEHDSNDLILADKWSIKLYRYRRGDVILLRYRCCRYQMVHVVSEASEWPDA